MEQDEYISSVHPIETIQTANKNIYSYFMKSEHSYYVPRQYKYVEYKKETDSIYIIVVTEYNSSTGDLTYRNNERAIEISCLIGKTQSLLHKRTVNLSSLGRTLQEIDAQEMGPGICAQQCFIGIVYPDGLNRSSLLGITEALLCHSRFKGVLLAPFTLCVSLGLCISNSIVAVKTGGTRTVSVIEDNCVSLQDPEPSQSSGMYGEDLADTLTVREDPVIEDILQCTCSMCGNLFNLEEFSAHFMNKHSIDVYKDQKKADEILMQCHPYIEPKKESVIEKKEERTKGSGESEGLAETIKKLIKRIPMGERYKKVISTFIFITEERTIIEEESISKEEDVSKEKNTSKEKNVSKEEKEARELLPEPPAQVMHLTKEESNITAWKGLYALASIEPAKDLWLTDKEWRSVGLRALKEKVLFPI